MLLKMEMPHRHTIPHRRGYLKASTPERVRGTDWHLMCQVILGKLYRFLRG